MPDVRDGLRQEIRVMEEERTRLLSEISSLGVMIDNAKAEIAALNVDDITATHIPTATDELDAVVAHTAQATDNILEVCEMLDGLAADNSLPPEVSERLQNATTRIYEACGFQDITGQRITKVVTTLQQIEARVAQILRSAGVRSWKDVTAVADGPDALMTGPQLPRVAMDQDRIDALMADL